MKPSSLLRRPCLAGLASLLVTAFSAGAAFKDQIGYTALKAEYPNLPTGRNLAILEIEFAVDWTNFNWAVAPGGELAGRQLTYLPASETPTAFSEHATAVASMLAGATSSILPEMPWLISTETDRHCVSSLRNSGSDGPLPPSWDLENTTSCWSNDIYAVGVLRRVDWRIDHQGVTFVAAVTNGDTPVPYVYCSAYNAIAVGVTGGTHARGGTLVEGVGRLKPDIVAPDNYTSGATPIVASCAGLLIDQAKSDARYAVAKDPRVIKALLLAGATKAEIPGWSHSPTQPLDAHFGAGQVNIANSYHMLVNGRQPAGNTVLSGMGWDKSTSGSGRYFLEVPAGQSATLSAVMTWHRVITPNADWSILTPSLADLNLRLSTATAALAVSALVAESRSPIDNVEHLYEGNLPAGRYVLEITGPAGTTYGIAWRSTLTPHPQPVVTTQPAAQSVAGGSSAFFSVDASGNPSPNYQWQRLPSGGSAWADLADGTGYSGTRTNALRVNGVSAALSGDQFRCVTTNSAGSATSAAAALTVTAATALLQRPTGLALDAAGNLYVTDTAQNTIKHITSSGTTDTLAGTSGAAGSQDGTGGAASFNQPNGIGVDAAGNVFVADSGNATVRRINSTGVVATLAGGAASRGSADGTGTAASFNAPDGLAVGPTGGIYVADTFNHTIRKITTAGVVTTIAGTAGSTGETDGGGTAARFNTPKALAVDGAGNLFVADTFNHTIRKIAPDGTVSTFAGSAGISGTFDGTGANALFNQPAGIASDLAGNLYVSDTGNCTIRKITAGGTVTTVAGLAGIAGWANATGPDALFNQPHGIVVTGSGTLVVADTGNGEIRRIATDGAVSTFSLSLAAPPPTTTTPTTTIPPATPPASGGGGGAMSPWFLVALAALGLARLPAQLVARRPLQGDGDLGSVR